MKVERSFNAQKQWRGMATRCALPALADRSAAILHALAYRESRPQKIPLGRSPLVRRGIVHQHLPGLPPGRNLPCPPAVFPAACRSMAKTLSAGYR
ncbi:hypothetical protein BLJ79_13395 [Arthrobacter sp. UCD-GKA]|nr:hypothetical protein BLJ79_13395 [Arthrobacter sp. UCD-GKA]